jgi:hypothetical protein
MAQLSHYATFPWARMACPDKQLLGPFVSYAEYEVCCELQHLIFFVTNEVL